jgi:hypothetical protein
MLEVDVRELGRPMDFTLNEIFQVPVVSGRVRELFSDLFGALFLPAHVAADSVVGDYFVMTGLSCVDCVDESRSQFQKFEVNDPVRPDLAGSYNGFTKLSIDSARASEAGLSIFRIRGYTRGIIVDELVRERFETLGLTGAVFSDVGV